MVQVANNVVLVGDMSNCNVASSSFAQITTIASALRDAFIIVDGSKLVGSAPPAVARLRELGFNVKIAPVAPKLMGSHDHGKAASSAFYSLELLKKLKIKTLHIANDLTAGYYLLSARKLGMCLQNTKVIVHVLSPILRQYQIGYEEPRSYADIARVFMEKKVIQLADLVTVTGRNVCDWLSKYEWTDEAILSPGPVKLLSYKNRQPIETTQLNTLIFSGTLNDIKGLTTFMYSADWLINKQNIKVKKIVLSGQILSQFPGEKFAEEWEKKLGISIIILPSQNQKLFFDTARMPGTLTVIASRQDDCSFTLNELVALNIPVIATDIGDNRRFLSEEDAQKILCGAHYLEVGKKIIDVYENGMDANFVSLRADVLELNGEAWRGLSSQVNLENDIISKISDKQKPLISVCIAHFNKPFFLELTLQSLQHQTYKNFEIIVVDDGSTIENFDRVKELIGHFPDMKIELIRQENLYLGAARNTGAKKARGKYLLFKDDDNISKPNEIETFVEVAERNLSEILVCFSDNFEGDSVPTHKNSTNVRRVSFGADLHYSMFRNGIGDSNCFILKSVWQKLGGFSEHYKIGLDDHEFFLRAITSGYKVDLIPEALYWYRLSGIKMSSNHISQLANQQRILTPLVESGFIPLEYLPMIMIARKKENNVRQ